MAWLDQAKPAEFTQRLVDGRPDAKFRLAALVHRLGNEIEGGHWPVLDSAQDIGRKPTQQMRVARAVEIDDGFVIVEKPMKTERQDNPPALLSPFLV